VRRRKIVVDANVARSSGTRTSDALACVNVLSEIYVRGHFVAFCPQLWKEWEVHQSSFAVKWLATMKSRKLIHHIDVDESLTTDFRRSLVNDAQEPKGIEDAHLILTALRASKVVVSNDEKARRFFAASKSGKVASIRWTNPCRAEQTILWIREGLTKRDDLLLCNFRPLH
jgi:hypothetical protein